MRSVPLFSLGATLAVATLTCGQSHAAAVLWSQDFSEGGAFSSYVDASQPTPDRFTFATGYSAFNTANQDLRITSPTGSYVTTYGLEFGTQAGYFQFGFTPVSSTIAGQIQPIALGSYSGTAATWASSAIQILNTSTMVWGIRNTQQGVNSDLTFTGAQTITYVINNTASAFAYDMGSGIQGTLDAGSFRVYVGNTLVTFGGTSTIAAANAGVTLEGFRLGGGNPAAGVVALDNIIFATLDPIPEPSTYAFILAGGTGILMALRRRKA